MVGKRAVNFGGNIEFIAARLPTLQIGVEKKHQSDQSPDPLY